MRMVQYAIELDERETYLYLKNLYWDCQNISWFLPHFPRIKGDMCLYVLYRYTCH